MTQKVKEYIRANDEKTSGVREKVHQVLGKLDGIEKDIYWIKMSELQQNRGKK